MTVSDQVIVYLLFIIGCLQQLLSCAFKNIQNSAVAQIPEACSNRLVLFNFLTSSVLPLRYIFSPLYQPSHVVPTCLRDKMLTELSVVILSAKKLLEIRPPTYRLLLLQKHNKNSNVKTTM